MRIWLCTDNTFKFLDRPLRLPCLHHTQPMYQPVRLNSGTNQNSGYFCVQGLLPVHLLCQAARKCDAADFIRLPAVHRHIHLYILLNSFLCTTFPCIIIRLRVSLQQLLYDVLMLLHLPGSRSNVFAGAFTYLIRSFCNFCRRTFQTKVRIIYIFKVCTSPNGNLFVIMRP